MRETVPRRKSDCHGVHCHGYHDNCHEGKFGGKAEGGRGKGDGRPVAGLTLVAGKRCRSTGRIDGKAGGAGLAAKSFKTLDHLRLFPSHWIPTNHMKQDEFTRFDLTNVPSKEDDRFEFKSSRTLQKDLGKKIAAAVSAFGNSGGGILVVGVDKEGKPDGGIPIRVERQERRDWVDQIVHQVEPTPAYDIRFIQTASDEKSGESRAVLLVWVGESRAGPHMAPDRRYYIRAGALTVPAPHFIVEAIWAKRYFSEPRLTHLIRSRPDDEETVQIGLVALTESPAIDIELAMEPLPGLYKKGCSEFPVHIGVIDRSTPFFFDVTTREQARRNSNDEFVLKLTYHDLASNSYTYQRPINLYHSLPSLRFFRKGIGDIVASLDSIKQELSNRSGPPVDLGPP